MMRIAFDVDRELCTGHDTDAELLGSHVRAHQSVNSITICNGNGGKTQRMCALDELFGKGSAF
jgi:hypothetical protein